MGENGVMADLERILTLWRELESAGRDYVLATVIAVEGQATASRARLCCSQRMARAGTVSGVAWSAGSAARLVAYGKWPDDPALFHG